MNNMRVLKAAILISFISFTFCSAQWVQTNGPLDAFVWSLHVKEDSLKNKVVFAGTYSGGVFLSTDTGANWRSVNEGLNTTSTFRSIISIGKYTFAANFNDCYRSTDNGISWIKLGKGKGMYVVNRLALSGTKIFAATGESIFESTDYGETWSLRSEFLLSSISALQVIDSVIFVGGQGASKYSKDNGNTWNNPKGIPDWAAFKSVIRHGNYLFGDCGDFCFKSTDKGESWVKSDSGITTKYTGPGHLESLISDGKDLYAAAGGNIFKSVDDGISWNIIPQNTLVSNPYQLALVNGIIIAGCANGIYISSDKGMSWKISNNGIIGSRIDVLASKDSCLYAGARGSRVFRSVDKGETWEMLSQRVEANGATSLLATPEGITISFNSSSVYFSPDFGNIWKPLPGGQPSSSGVTVYSLIYDNGSYFAGTPSGMYYQRSAGEKWEARNNGLTNPYVRSLLRDAKFLYAGTYGGEGVYRSTDYGLNWTRWNSGLTDTIALNLCKAGPNIFVSTRSGIFRFDGSTWRDVYPKLNGYVGLYTIGNYLLTSRSSGLWMTCDYGTTWTDINSGLGDHNVRAITVMGDDIYAATFGGGVFRRPLKEIIKIQSDVSDSRMKYDFSLNQNYPNPFNPSTIISYSISKESFVELKIYDMLGREITTLVNKEQTAGEHKVQFDGRNLPSGVYIYTIQAGQFRDSKKLLLLK